MKKLIASILAIITLWITPAIASEWNFYGSTRTHIGHYTVDKNFLGGPATDTTIRADGTNDDSGTLLNLYGQSRIGVKVKVADNLTGAFEFGLRNSSSSGGEVVYLRQAWGKYNFGVGSIMMGKNYTPATFLGYASMGGDLGDNGDANMVVHGLAYISRKAQIRLTFGNFDIALIEANTKADDLGYGDVDFVLPRIEAAYAHNSPAWSLRPIIAFQTYSAEDNATGDEETITSYTLGLGTQVRFGPAYIKATFSYLQNPGNYGDVNLLVNNAKAVGATNAQLIDGSVEDSEEMQGTFVVGAKLNQIFGMELGIGYGHVEQKVASLGNVTVEQTGFAYYLQTPLQITTGFKVIPEIGYIDRDDYQIDGVDVSAGDMTYIDISFKVDF